MSLSRYQLERADLTTTIEQGRRVEIDLFQENSRGMRTMGELLKARMFGATEYALSLRKRMMDYQHQQPGPVIVAAKQVKHGIECPCDDCDLAVKRLLRDCGVLPKGKPNWASFTVEPESERLKMPARYRKDESDR
jgi:hypothetical protein